MTIFFCWICGIPIMLPKLCAPGYEDPDLRVFFCSKPHQDEYLWLARL